MSLSTIVRRNKIIFEEQFNKKSNYFRKLQKTKINGLKKIEEDKIELIINKIIGIGEFKRDYSLFANTQNKQRQNTEKKNISKNMKYKIENILEKSYEKKRQNRRYYDSYNRENIVKNDKYDKSRSYSKGKKYKTIIFKNDANQQNQEPTFLSSIGKNIITSNNSFVEKNKI